MWVFEDLGVSRGMESGIAAAHAANVKVERRVLPPYLMRHVAGESLQSTLVPCGVAAATLGVWGVGAAVITRRAAGAARRLVSVLRARASR